MYGFKFFHFYKKIDLKISSVFICPQKSYLKKVLEYTKKDFMYCANSYIKYRNLNAV